MAKKIAKVPLGEDFLAGYKPVTPDFADIPMDNDVAPEPVPGPKGVEDDFSEKPSEPSAPKIRPFSDSFVDTFLKGGTDEKKNEKVYLTLDHLICLREIVQAIRSKTGKNMTIGNYVWNILEHHFSTYQKDIAGLIDQRKHKSLDRFK
ncbi:DUF3408 domain-containing protein [uncultured Duncaniella sp.]|uniref:DUF3408 domain-containing protein n=1 Tax=uncultured Duncaniella sp. TaxID=2768039 RepID=UPI0025A96F42|nr:DUF3408 domain-containing protein [uncultured Duncaniella sp.]